MLIDELKKRKQFLDLIIKETSQNIKELPGKIRCNNVNGRYYYYFKGNESAGYRYLSINDMQLAREIAQGEYDEEVIKMAQKELKLVDSLLKCEEPEALAGIYDDLSEARKELVKPCHISNELFARKWQEESFVGNLKYEIKPAIKTRRGEFVRSKAELAVADTLFALGIPYKYECPLKFKNGKIVYPDFTTLNVRERRIYYIEYLGMLDNQEYRNDAIFKMNEYEKNGIFEGKNLIAFRDYDGRNIDTQSIARKCKAYLL